MKWMVMDLNGNYLGLYLAIDNEMVYYVDMEGDLLNIHFEEVKIYEGYYLTAN